MIIKKEDPEINELVLVEITKVMPFGAYCVLTEYQKEAYLPISEVASGWIKNIHEFIKEGQKRVAKVIFVDNVKKVVDISFKKVSKKEEKDKIKEYNLESRAEKLFEKALQAANTTNAEQEIRNKLGKKYTYFTDVIDAIQQGAFDYKSLGINETVAKALEDTIKENIRPKKYDVAYTVEIILNETKGGIDAVKSILEKAEKTGVEITYVSAPKYRITSEGNDYLEAEEKIKTAYKTIMAAVKGGGMVNLKKEKINQDN